MSKKPPKHSERKQMPFYKTSRQIRREAPDYHLIVMEGSETEPPYFNALANKVNAQFANRVVEFVFHSIHGGTAKTVLEEAGIALKKNPRCRHVWLVYDKDQNSADDFNQVAQTCANRSSQEEEEEEVQWHALWSNNCFEVWFLLHFCTTIPTAQGYPEGKNYREHLCDLLTEHLGEKYTKSEKGMYQKLEIHLEAAIRNAERYEKEFAKTKATPADCDPFSTVYQLINELKLAGNQGKSANE
ncbi:MAG: RloB family protein [Oscillospiraceae bacterium]|jgi:hypothetical protein|nr:RloB family protein [Oscillospiraceae bacterium]